MVRIIVVAFLFVSSLLGQVSRSGVQVVQEEGSDLAKRNKINFIGSSLTCVDNSGTKATDCTVVGATVYNQTIKDETSALTQRTSVNFTGAGITCADNAGTSTTDCTVATVDHYSYVHYRPAVCQATTATSAFNLPAAATAPAAACVTGTNTNYGVLQFVKTAVDVVQDNFFLPAAWLGTADLYLKWRTAATSGSVVWQVQTICVADAETGDPSFNAASTVTDVAKGTTLQWNDASIATVTVTGCAAGEQLLWKLSRDPDHASDDLDDTAELVSLTWRLQ